MSDASPTARGQFKFRRQAALGLAVGWAGWWTFFGLASSLGEGLDPVGTVIHVTVPGLLFLASAVVALRWQRWGGGVLTAVGLIMAVAYPLRASHESTSTIIFVLATMALPPLIAGLLLLSSRPKRPQGGGPDITQ